MSTLGVMRDRRGSRAAAAVGLSVIAALSVAGCAAASSAPPPTKPAPSSTIVHGSAASCASLTPSQQFAAAKLVFDGEMLSGATVPGTDGIFASPARVGVKRYVKGSGAAVVTVQTAITTVKAGTVMVIEDGIRPRAGERWRIYASNTSEPYSTSTCLGSHRLPARTRHFSSAGEISFDYPATWHARTYPMPPAPFSTWLVWLSPQRMHAPCMTRHGTHTTTITCGDPLSRLRPNSILAYWTSNADPAWRFRLQRGVPITVAGRRGKWLVQTDTAQAPRLGETEEITVVVPTPATSDSWFQLTVLLRGPDTAGVEAQVKTMLRSVHWLTPGPAK
jgi:hypothetical protein